jgi:hypothetical protein
VTEAQPAGARFVIPGGRRWPAIKELCKFGVRFEHDAAVDHPDDVVAVLHEGYTVTWDDRADRWAVIRDAQGRTWAQLDGMRGRLRLRTYAALHDGACVSDDTQGGAAEARSVDDELLVALRSNDDDRRLRALDAIADFLRTRAAEDGLDPIPWPAAGDARRDAVAALGHTITPAGLFLGPGWRQAPGDFGVRVFDERGRERLLIRKDVAGMDDAVVLYRAD